LSVPGRARTIAIMTNTPSTLPSAVSLAVEDDIDRGGVPSSATGSFGALTGRLAEVAHAIRVAADHFEELPDVAVAFANIERALGDLAAAAELTGYAVIERDRPAGARATQVPPTPPARAVSWRLHGLAGALRTLREVCLAVQSAGRELALSRVPRSDRGLTGFAPRAPASGPVDTRDGLRTRTASSAWRRS
jgi:hypothetical protein